MAAARSDAVKPGRRRVTHAANCSSGGVRTGDHAAGGSGSGRGGESDEEMRRREEEWETEVARDAARGGGGEQRHGVVGLVCAGRPVSVTPPVPVPLASWLGRGL
jgi:hypothetical protein